MSDRRLYIEMSAGHQGALPHAAQANASSVDRAGESIIDVETHAVISNRYG
jgi:hypothetical protein